MELLLVTLIAQPADLDLPGLFWPLLVLVLLVLALGGIYRLLSKSRRR